MKLQPARAAACEMNQQYQYQQDERLCIFWPLYRFSGMKLKSSPSYLCTGLAERCVFPIPVLQLRQQSLPKADEPVRDNYNR